MIIDWNYYSSHFPNVVPELQFNSVEMQAEVEYKKVVKPYMDIPEDIQKDCIFQLCNFLYTNKSVISGKSVTSVNNNGYSESYSLQTTSQCKDEMREIIYSCIGTRLAGAF